MSSSPSLSHIPQLDGVRAIAVSLVMVSHAGLEFVPGGFGVTIFFFLSGYLITTLLRVEHQKNGRVDLPAFYLRRTLRIMPALYVTLIILTILYPFGTFGRPINWPAVPWDYLFLSNYSPLWGQGGGLPVPLWSLAIEEHFYLVFPAAFILLTRSWSWPRVALALGIACAVVLLLRFATPWFGFSLEENFYWTHTRLDSLLFGCLLAVLHNPVLDRGAWSPKDWHVAAAGLTILTTFVVRDAVFRETIRYTIQGLALFVLFSFILSGRSQFVTKVLSLKPVVWVGLVSYSLYLCHMAIFAAMSTLFDLDPLTAGILGLPIALLYVWAMRRWVELPIINWRRTHQSKVKAIAAPAAAPNG